MTVTTTERAELGYGLAADEGEAFWLLGMLETIKIGGEDTGGQFGLVEIVARAGEGSPWHVHPEEDEWFYVLDGEFTFHVGDAQLDLSAGGFAFGPKGIPHTFIAGRAGGKALVGFAPFQFEGSCVRSASPPPNASSPRRSRRHRTWRASSRSASRTGSRSSGLLDRRPAGREP